MVAPNRSLLSTRNYYPFERETCVVQEEGIANRDLIHEPEKSLATIVRSRVRNVGSRAARFALATLAHSAHSVRDVGVQDIAGMCVQRERWLSDRTQLNTTRTWLEDARERERTCAA